MNPLVILGAVGIGAYLLMSQSSSGAGAPVAANPYGGGGGAAPAPSGGDTGGYGGPTNLGSGGSSTPVGPAAVTSTSDGGYGGPTSSPAPTYMVDETTARFPNLATGAGQGMSTYGGEATGPAGGFPAASMGGTAAGRVGARAQVTAQTLDCPKEFCPELWAWIAYGSRPPRQPPPGAFRDNYLDVRPPPGSWKLVTELGAYGLGLVDVALPVWVWYPSHAAVVSPDAFGGGAHVVNTVGRATLPSGFGLSYVEMFPGYWVKADEYWSWEPQPAPPLPGGLGGGGTSPGGDLGPPLPPGTPGTPQPPPGPPPPGGYPPGSVTPPGPPMPPAPPDYTPPSTTGCMVGARWDPMSRRYY